jgi:hypothetical protein
MGRADSSPGNLIDQHPRGENQLMRALQYSVGVAFAVVAWAACSSKAVTAPASVGCSTAALTGTFGSQRNGQTKPGTMISAVGLATFDGNGNVAEQQSVMTNGVFSSVTNQAETYAINPDCTGTLTDASGNLAARLTMVHDGTEVLGESTVPGSNEAMHFETITGPCSLATLNGSYGFQRNGTTSAGTLLAIGTITFDGQGNFVASQIIDRNGTFGTATSQIGTYAVNPDCTSTSSDTTRSVFTQQVIVAGADETIGISTTPGNNVVVHGERVK